jgi:predicted nucleic acid-binding protein
VDDVLAGSDRPAICEPIVFELAVGARTAGDDRAVASLVSSCVHVTVSAPSIWEAAVAAHRTCRRGGETVRSMTDCLVAAVALREDLEVLHCDRDYVTLARHLPVRQRTS